ncbi:hypothetical protein [Parathalassolituus penaei]|uniref:Amino acid transport protein n=1 Tax=Parathalassolituus penaei TaxID=2997323 RepID=A0A9X3EAW6_9GAMM|nr:hypothetical protein [Parathalassolituus penaei]MCY0963821.1 hypothetical protein [Parathalassolituus penaei]
MNLMLVGLVFSSIGFGYFIYGKRQQQPVYRYSGLALMLYPYAVTSMLPLVLIGCALLAIPRFIRM